MKLALIAMIVFLLFFSIYAYIYNTSKQSLKKSTIEQTQTYLLRGAEEISASYSNVASFTHLAKMEHVRALALTSSNGITPRNFAHMIHLSNYLNNLTPAIDSVSQIALFIDNEAGLLCGTDVIFHNFRSAYEDRLLYAENFDYNSFRELILKYANTSYTRRFIPAMELYSKSSSKLNANTIMCVQKLSVPQSDVYFILFINTEVLISTLIGDNQYGECITLADSHEIIYSKQEISMPLVHNDETKNNTTDGITLSIPIKSLGVNASISLRDEDILSHISHFSSLWNLLLVTFFVLSIALFTLLLVYFVYPLQRLFMKLRNSPVHKNHHLRQSILCVENEMSQLSEASKELTISLSKWQPIIRNNLLDKLLRHDYLMPAEREIIQSLPEIEKDKYFRAAIIGNISDSSCFTRDIWGKIERIISDSLPGALVYPFDNTAFTVLLQSNEYYPLEQDDVTSQMQKLLDNLNRFVNNEDAFAIGIGFSYHGLSNAHISFCEASAAFREADTWKNSSVISYEKAGLGAFKYHLSYDDLERLYNLLISGDAEKACVELNEYVKRDFGENNSNTQSRVFCHQFYNDVLGMLVRLASQLNLMPVLDSLTEFSDALPFNKLLEQINQFFYYVGEVVVSSRISSIQNLTEEMKLYIKENYSDSNLSLTMLSDVFVMSESTLSKYFKSKLGINFSTYLEKLRLGEAEKLLINSQLSITEISCKVGYANTTTFYKAFKRKHGVSPTEWITQHGNCMAYTSVYAKTLDV